MKIKRTLSAVLFTFCVGSGIVNIFGVFNMNVERLAAMQRFELTFTSIYFVAIPAIISIALIIIPKTYSIGCTMNASILASIATIFLIKGDFSSFIIEIPFIMIPLIMIYLGHPAKIKGEAQNETKNKLEVVA
jgi:hypothetical protein